MKKTSLIFLFLVLALGMFTTLSAAVSTYVFTQTTGTYSEITGGTVLGATTSDDQRFVDAATPLGSTSVLTGVGLPIGFNFTLDGNTFDRFAVNFNGWISLGQSALTPSVNIGSSTNYPAPLNSTTVLAPTYLRTRIAGFAQDLQGQAGSELSYLTTGAPGSQILVVQWKGVKRYSTTVTSNVNFQIRLYEGLNQVEVIYGGMTNNYALTAWVAQVGLGGSVQADFNNRTSTTDWSATSPGAAANSTIPYSSTIYPLSGLTFAWSMPSGPPVLGVSPEDWDFGTVIINGVATKVFILSNTGGGTVTINSVTPNGLYFDVTVQPTDLSLGAGESTPFTVSFSPLADGGPFVGTVTVNYDTSAKADFVIDLSGTCVDPTINVFNHLEGFDGPTFPPLGWTNVKTAGTGIGLWDRQTAGTYPTCLPVAGTSMARYNSFGFSAGTNGILVTPPLNFGTELYYVDFWMYRDIGYPTNADLINVHYNTAPNLTGATLLGTINRSTTLEPVVADIGWYAYSFPIPVAGKSIGFIVFEGVSQYGNNMFVDEVLLREEIGNVPVELSSFTATLTAQNYVQLTWVSQSESQMVGYRVYRNTSNTQATSVLVDTPLVPATNTSTMQTYSATDTEVEIGTTYFYWLEAVDYNSSTYHGPVSVTVEGDVPPVLPELTTMKNAYPNPFKGNTIIEVGLKAGETGTVTIYNLSGQVVRTFAVTEGNHSLNWNGRDANGQSCGSGIYFYRLNTPSLNQTRKLILAN